jgi:hypothetical protein
LRQLKNESVFAGVLNTIQIFTNLVYLFKYIVKLDQKRFHYLMVALLTGYAIFNLGYCVTFLLMYYTNFTLQQDMKLYYSGNWFYTIGTTQEYLAHSIFVIKYWVVAKKVTSIVTNTHDPWF